MKPYNKKRRRMDHSYVKNGDDDDDDDDDDDVQPENSQISFSVKDFPITGPNVLPPDCNCGGSNRGHPYQVQRQSLLNQLTIGDSQFVYNVVICMPALSDLHALFSAGNLTLIYPLGDGKVGVVEADRKMAKKCLEMCPCFV